MGYQESVLWRRYLAHTPDDSPTAATAKQLLRNCFANFRDRASVLVNRISADLPDYTVHDISHLDALWETASLVAGSHALLNPLEVFTLGGAILVHDAGMTLASYPGGISQLEKTVEWLDAVASEARKLNPQNPPNFKQFPEESKKSVLSSVIRLRHALHAADLLSFKWPAADGDGDYYLIEDIDVRKFLGPIIGKIAQSHWFRLSDLQSRLPSVIGPPPFAPTEWSIDPIKIASILRLADAAHIDGKRAPGFLQALLKPSGISATHWAFQAKMAKPYVEDEAFVFTSGPAFSSTEFQAWWQCYDAIKVIHEEALAVDSLLEELGKPRLAVKRVRGAHDPKALSQYVRTDGWRPIEARPFVSNISSLIKMLGGEHLYGQTPQVALREAIQNSADAIRHRRALEERSDKFGSVMVSIEHVCDVEWLQVRDDGIGMSPRTLTGTLIDFGQSLWKSDLAREEFPGLSSKHVEATGRFGIGFFSIFMISEEIQVISRRYDAGPMDTHVLEFKGGLDLRPLIRPASEAERLLEPGTLLRAKLKRPSLSSGGLLVESAKYGTERKFSLSRLITRLCASSDVDIHCLEKGKYRRVIKAGDWKLIKGEKLIDRTSESEPSYIGKTVIIQAENVRKITEDSGEVVGRGCLLPDYFDGHGILTIGGLFAARCDSFAGILIAEPSTAARSHGKPKVSFGALSRWANEQAILIGQSALDVSAKFDLVAPVMACGGDPKPLPIAIRGGKFFTHDQLVREFKKARKVVVHEGALDYDDLDDACSATEFEEDLAPDTSIYFTPDEMAFLVENSSMEWPDCIFPTDYSSNPIHVFYRAIREAWGIAFEITDEELDVAQVRRTRGGSVEITRPVVVLEKRKKS